MKLRRDQVIDELVENDMEKMEDGTIADVLREGCRGYDNILNEELAEIYEEQLSYKLEEGETVTIEE